jgi:hypothetical protein
VRQADHQLGWIVLGIAAVYLAGAAVVSTAADPRRGGPVAGIALLAIVVAGVAGVVYVGVRIRAYSRTGSFLYFGGIAAFNVWNGVVAGVSIGTRYWASTQPSYHFGVSVAVATIPLLVVGWLILRR